jgi:hypothetical protein
MVRLKGVQTVPRTYKPLTTRTWVSASELPLQARLRLEHAEKWVAWSSDLTRIIASGDDPTAVHEAARQSGEEGVVYEWVPPVPVRPIEIGK